MRAALHTPMWNHLIGILVSEKSTVQQRTYGMFLEGHAELVTVGAPRGGNRVDSETYFSLFTSFYYL